jgi:TatD DNase family protein
LIDLHCHIDLYPDPKAILDEAEARGAFVLAVTTTPKAWRGTCKLVGERARIRVALGLHPEVVADRYGEVELLCALIPEARYIGEIGLDGSPPHRASIDVQVKVFDRILDECEKLGGRILTIHSRSAADRVLDAIELHPRAGLPILHWFSGSTKQLERAASLGCWFSVGPAMVRSTKGRDLAAAMPLERILTETDAPFARSGDRPLYPWEATDCVPELADLHGLDRQQMFDAIKRNLKALAGWQSPPPGSSAR